MDQKSRRMQTKATYLDLAHDLSAMQRSAEVSMPITITGSRASMAHDTRIPVMVETPRGLAESLVHLKRSLLVRLKLVRHNGETVSILCGSEDMGSGGMNLMLPCKLGLTPGTPLEMELFLSSDQDPIAVRGRVSKSTRNGNGDVTRYIIEVEFCQLSGMAEKEIAAFMHSSMMDSYQQMLAQ